MYLQRLADLCTVTTHRTGPIAVASAAVATAVAAAAAPATPSLPPGPLLRPGNTKHHRQASQRLLPCAQAADAAAAGAETGTAAVAAAVAGGADGHCATENVLEGGLSFDDAEMCLMLPTSSVILGLHAGGGDPGHTLQVQQQLRVAVLLVDAHMERLDDLVSERASGVQAVRQSWGGVWVGPAVV